MSDTPQDKNDSSMVPQAVRDDYNEWLKTGKDETLSKLIAHLFASLEIDNYEDIIRDKGENARFNEDLNVDSLTLAEILFYTEDLLSIRIPNEDVINLRTVGNLKEYLSSRRNECQAK